MDFVAEQMDEEEEGERERLPYQIGIRARSGKRGGRLNRRFKPDRLLGLLEENPLPRKSVFTCRKPTFKDSEGRKYYRDAPVEQRREEKGAVTGWYYMALPARRSTEDVKVRWPGDTALTIVLGERRVRASIELTQRPPTDKTVIARVYLRFD